MTNKQTLEKIKDLLENEKHFRWARFWEGTFGMVVFIIFWVIALVIIKIFHL
mgnify:CR=1 FL=1